MLKYTINNDNIPDTNGFINKMNIIPIDPRFNADKFGITDKKCY